MASSDQVWYFFGRKESRYNRGERQKRKTKSGFWKKTGKTLPITRKSGNHETIGEKRVLIFYTNGSRSNWVMHEYRASCLSPNDVHVLLPLLCFCYYSVFAITLFLLSLCFCHCSLFSLLLCFHYCSVFFYCVKY